MADLQTIAATVKQALAEDFRPVRILDVTVEEDADADGMPVLRIDVVYEGTVHDLDARKLVGAVGLLRPRLAAIDVATFPLLTFISRADIRPRALAS
ncbi:MAG: hypothetical protein KIS96_13625 [Bauldia sp.]|nr:hypothetical protein [Bauldia sp.]